MHEEIQDEYPVYEEDEIQKHRKSLLYAGLGLLVFAAIGASLAQTITLNTTGRVEFGQGTGRKACFGRGTPRRVGLFSKFPLSMSDTPAIALGTCPKGMLKPSRGGRALEKGNVCHGRWR